MLSDVKLTLIKSTVVILIYLAAAQGNFKTSGN